MIATYDKAMVNKIKQWYDNTIYANTAVTYNSVFNASSTEQTELKFPLINIYRPSGYEPSETQTFAGRRQGQLFYQNTEKAVRGRFIVVDLMYQLDFYAKSTESMDKLSLEIIQAINAYPMLKVNHKSVKYDLDVTEEYEIQYMGGPTEQSEFDSGDRTYRSFAQFKIQNVRLYNYAENFTIKDVETTVEIQDQEEVGL